MEVELDFGGPKTPRYVPEMSCTFFCQSLGDIKHPSQWWSVGTGLFLPLTQNGQISSYGCSVTDVFHQLFYLILHGEFYTNSGLLKNKRRKRKPLAVHITYKSV